MIDHPYVQHPVWPRDQCEHRLDEEKDGAYGICAAPRSEHSVTTCEVCLRPPASTYLRNMHFSGGGIPAEEAHQANGKCFEDGECWEIGYRREKARAEKAEADFANACAVGRQHEARANTMEAMLAAKGKR